MRLRLRRPRYQRSVRVLLAFALVIPAGTILQVSGPNPASLVFSGVLVALALFSAIEAFRWVVVITRHGIGIRGVLGMQTAWLAWGEIVQIDVDGPVVSLTTRGRSVHQVQLEPRAAALLGRMVEREIVGRVRL